MLPTIALADSSPADAKVDALVVFGHAGPDASTPARLTSVATGALPRAAADHVARALSRLRAKGATDEVIKLVDVPKIAAPLLVVAGLGDVRDGESPTPEALRRAAGAALRSLRGLRTVAVAVPAGPDDLAAAAASGAALGAYRFDHHRGAKAKAKADDDQPARIDVLAPAGKRSAVRDAVADAEVLARHQAWARDLVNTGPNELYPESLAQAVCDRAGRGVSVDILDETALGAGGLAGHVSVGGASARPPRLVTLTYAPKGAGARLAFVGKGITFDSGGLCIKPGASMVAMKCDMAGAAAVAGAVLAAAELKLPVAVIGYLCLAENMPGGGAYRPGDVLTMRDGKTVEVINTDAEGRFVLADGLCLASEQAPDAIVDVATLTGAAITALGRRTAAVMANDDELQGALTSAATAAGEAVWPMPIAEETRAGMNSIVADLKHTGEPVGGSMVAAAFLREFVGTRADGEPIPWGHLDIAGPAYNETGAHGYTPKGATGFGVRTLVEFVRAHV